MKSNLQLLTQLPTPAPAQKFLFCHKCAGTILFSVDSDSNGDLPLDKAASLLAMHSFKSGMRMEDYSVHLELGSPSPELTKTVKKLLEDINVRAPNQDLTTRERQILGVVLQGKRRKEIATQLHIAERMVA